MATARSRRSRATAAPAGTVVGYIRVSTDEQVESGAGLAAQRAAIEAECARRGWTLVETFEDAGASGKSLDGRPQLAAALEAVESGRAAALMVYKLDRLSRSLVDASGLLDRAERQGWGLVALDIGVDMTTPQGQAMAGMTAVFAQLERGLIGQRTRDALAVRRAAGVRLGRPSVLPPEVVARIVAEHRAGDSLRVIGARLEAEGVATARGGSRWHASAVRAVLNGQDAQRLMQGGADGE